MAMLDSFRKLIARLEGEPDAAPYGADELKAATAALLVHAAAVDGHIAGAERGTLARLIATHFAIPDDEAEALLVEGEERERRAVDIYTFTRVLTDRLGQEERQEIVELMWEVVCADGEVHPYESNLVWRAAELIGVSTRDRVAMRQRVFARRGITGSG
jgi:uncharacterized tellurite resistance protein B-like protein